MNNQIPKRLKKYFWDCKFEDLQWDKYYFFISERLLNFGNPAAINWLLRKLDAAELRNIVMRSKNLDVKSRNFWTIMLNED